MGFCDDRVPPAATLVDHVEAAERVETRANSFPRERLIVDDEGTPGGMSGVHTSCASSTVGDDTIGSPCNSGSEISAR